jgi:signal peptidase I
LRKILRDVVFPLLIAFVVAMFAQATVAKPYQIPSGSMLPTIQLQDRILANRLVYRIHSIERGDVIVFQPPEIVDQSTPYVKRVVGLPGDKVEVARGKTFVNEEEFIVPTASTPTYARKAETVPDGMLFVLGDNRNESSDSHIWGYVPIDNVIGRADIVYWPPKNLHLLGN